MAEVVLGAQDRGCAGSGVCRLIPFQRIKKWTNKCARYQTEIVWYEHQQQLSMSIDLKQIEAKEQLKWFADPYFLVEEDFFFPLWFQHQSKQKNSYIPAGKYPFNIDKTNVQLFFSLKKQKSLRTDQLRTKAL